MNSNSRAPKLLGDFGEGLVTYALIRKGFEVACVDHVGADLIAIPAKQGKRAKQGIAVSVKTRLYKHNSEETRGITIKSDHIKKLRYFANRFNLEPVFAHVVSIMDDKIIHLFMLRVDDIKKLKKATHGRRIWFGKNHLEQTKSLSFVDYSSWSNEKIGKKRLSKEAPIT